MNSKKFFIDVSTKIALPVGENFIPGIDTLITAILSSANNGVASFSVDNVLVQQQFSESAQRCISPIAILVKKGSTCLFSASGDAWVTGAYSFGLQ